MMVEEREKGGKRKGKQYARNDGGKTDDQNKMRLIRETKVRRKVGQNLRFEKGKKEKAINKRKIEKRRKKERKKETKKK